MAKKCRVCGKDVPADRWGSSWYCSDEHWYDAKRKRSSDRYHKIKERADHVTKNEEVLKLLLLATQFGAAIRFEDLAKAGLDLGLSTGELAGQNGEIWKMIGEHAYYTNPETKRVSLWKRK
jgi:hypothetical protein